jgi:hypothetical protein
MSKLIAKLIFGESYFSREETPSNKSFSKLEHQKQTITVNPCRICAHKKDLDLSPGLNSGDIFIPTTSSSHTSDLGL